MRSCNLCNFCVTVTVWLELEVSGTDSSLHIHVIFRVVFFIWPPAGWRSYVFLLAPSRVYTYLQVSWKLYDCATGSLCATSVAVLDVENLNGCSAPSRSRYSGSIVRKDKPWCRRPITNCRYTSVVTNSACVMYIWLVHTCSGIAPWLNCNTYM